MNDWQIALEKFLAEYKDKEYFLGALLSGSYATGNNDENSDIDVYIVTTDDTPWRERGNKNIDGFLIEYFINPKRVILSYLEKELKDYHMSTTMIFVNGKILYDKNGDVEELVNIAKNNAKLDRLADVDEFKFKMNCYSVWDGFDELDSKYKKHQDIDFSYYIFLERILDSYFYNKQIPSIPLNKIEQVFKDGEYKRKYNVVKLPEQEFIEKVIKCLDEKNYDKRYENAKELYEYFLSQFPSFDINNLAVRSSSIV